MNLGLLHIRIRVRWWVRPLIPVLAIPVAALCCVSPRLGDRMATALTNAIVRRGLRMRVEL